MTLTTESAYLPSSTTQLPQGSWLVLAPHPNDESFGMGGSLLLAQTAKTSVDIIFLTDGQETDLSDAESAEKREKKATIACRKLGIRNILFWREIDRELSSSQHLIKRLSDFIKKHHYTTVFFPSPQEPHPDHRTTAVLAWESLRQLNFSADPISYEISPQGYTNQLIDITEVIAKKQQIMACYDSKISSNHYIDRILGLNQARAWSLPLSVSHAEAFYTWPKEDRPLNALLLSIASQQTSLQVLPHSLPLVSVITRTQNRPEFLREAIRSVAGQTYPNIELIVVNDGGAGCEQLVKEESTGHIQQYHYQQLEHQSGRSHAANVGLDCCKGEFIIFLDDDDWFLPEHIESLINSLNVHPDALAAYNNVACVRWEDNQWQVLHEFHEPFNKERLAYENYIPIHSILFKRKLIDSGYLFVESMEIYEDWAFWMKASQFGSFIHNNMLGAMYRVGATSGVGLPGTNQSFAIDYQVFIKWAKNEWDYSQALALVRNSIDINDVKENLVATEERLKATLKQLDITEGWLSSTTKQLNITEGWLTGTTEKVDIAEEKLRNMEKSLNECKEQLDNAVKESNQHLTEKNILLSSTSWKILAPLRAIVHPVKQLKSMITTYLFQLIRQFKIAFSLISQGRFIELFSIIAFKIRKKMINLDQNMLTIVATKHTMYVAYLIEKELTKTSFKTQIITQVPDMGYGTNLHFVICPQMFDALPKHYFAVQMEQSVNPRWFTETYFTLLNDAIAVLDYSLVNIEYLQKHGIKFQNIFYIPISYFNQYREYLYKKESNFIQKTLTQFNINLKEKQYLMPQKKEYEVLFYGDINNTRRRRFLDKISTQFKTKVIGDVFGEALYEQILSAQVVINIHYYENALLESTRIYECLSLGLPVISESSSDINEHTELKNLVSFTPVDDIDAMIVAIRQSLKQTEQDSGYALQEQRVNTSKFSYFFNRFLLAQELISYSHFYEQTKNHTNLVKQSGTCLSLPETIARQKFFIESNTNNFSIFNGLRHNIGWIGCGLSYKDMINRAKDKNLDYIIICEDDVEFYPKFEQHLKTILNYLEYTPHSWNIFSGLIADLHSDSYISHSQKYKNMEFIHINKMTSMIFNIYHSSIFDKILQWDETDFNDQTNTIDRFLENSTDLKVITTLPFLVGHHEERDSTLWGVKNCAYNQMIDDSKVLLEQKLLQFKSSGL